MQFLDGPYKTLLVGDSKSGKTNELRNLKVTNQILIKFLSV